MPLGDPPVAIVYDGHQARITEADGQVVFWDAPFDAVAAHAQRLGLVAVPTTEYVAAWTRP